MDFANPSSIDDVQIGLDMDLTGLTNYYIKTETDNNLLLKADRSITYTKTEVDNSLALNSNQATTYNKAEVDNSLALKQNVINNAPGTGERLLEANFLERIFTFQSERSNLSKNDNFELRIDEPASFGTIRCDRIFSSFDIHCGAL